MKFITEQSVYIVESFARKKKLTRKCIRKFRRKYPDSPVPTASCVSKLVKKWRATGSVCDMKHSKRIVLTGENIRDIEVRRLAQETGVSLGSAFTATKLIKYRPYKVTVVHER
jgi:hypothetical protein